MNALNLLFNFPIFLLLISTKVIHKSPAKPVLSISKSTSVSKNKKTKGEYFTSKLAGNTSGELENSFRDLIRKIGKRRCILEVDKTIIFSDSVTIPANIDVRFQDKCFFDTTNPNIVVDVLSTNNVTIEQFGAIGDGLTDNTVAFIRFNNWAKRKSKQVTLNFKPGGVYRHRNPYFTINIRNLIVNGNSATIDNFTDKKGDEKSLMTASGFGIQSGLNSRNGIVNHYLLEHAGKGFQKISTKNRLDVSNFHVNEWVAIVSMNITIGGFPPNFKHFEYRRIEALDKVNGVITLDKPLEINHDSNALNMSFSKISGEPSIYKIEQGSSFSIDQRFNNLNFVCSTISKPSHDDYVIASGLSLSFQGCVFQNFDPTAAGTVFTSHCTNNYTAEFDKLVDVFKDYKSTWKGAISSATSFNQLEFKESVIGGFDDLTPRSLKLLNVQLLGKCKIGGRVGGIDTLVIKGGTLNSSPAYSITSGQTATVVIGDGVSYKNGALTISMDYIKQIWSCLPFLSRCDNDRIIFVTSANNGKEKSTGNKGIISGLSCDKSSCTVKLKFDAPIEDGDKLTIFNEPKYSQIDTKIKFNKSHLKQSFVMGSVSQ